jgi:hypothetical protein
MVILADTIRWEAERSCGCFLTGLCTGASDLIGWQGLGVGAGVPRILLVVTGVWEDRATCVAGLGTGTRVNCADVGSWLSCTR